MKLDRFEVPQSPEGRGGGRGAEDPFEDMSLEEELQMYDAILAHVSGESFSDRVEISDLDLETFSMAERLDYLVEQTTERITKLTDLQQEIRSLLNKIEDGEETHDDYQARLRAYRDEFERELPQLKVVERAAQGLYNLITDTREPLARQLDINEPLEDQIAKLKDRKQLEDHYRNLDALVRMFVQFDDQNEKRSPFVAEAVAMVEALIPLTQRPDGQQAN